MNDKNSYFECKRCSFKCDKKKNMEKHLNRKILCIKKFDSFCMNDEELYNLSLIKNYIKSEDKTNNKFICENCNKYFNRKDSLQRHSHSSCKIIKNNNKFIKDSRDSLETEKNILENTIDNDSINRDINNNIHIKITEKNNDELHKNIYENCNYKIRGELNNRIYDDIDQNKDQIKEINDEILNKLINGNNSEKITKLLSSRINVISNLQNSNNNIIDNSINHIDNSINNFNITIVNSFDQAWTTSHIDDKTKVLLLLNKCKFTTTLENILENEVNLNVLIDKKTDNGIIYENNTMKNTTVKDIVKRTMEKIYKHLTDFTNEAQIYNIDIDMVNDQIMIAGKKYDEFKKNKTIQEKVNTCIKDIYCKKQLNTYGALNKINHFNQKDGY